jgi:hypothetical protein
VTPSAQLQRPVGERPSATSQRLFASRLDQATTVESILNLYEQKELNSHTRIPRLDFIRSVAPQHLGFDLPVAR